ICPENSVNFKQTTTTKFITLSLPDALPISFRFVDLGLPDPFGLEDARLLLGLGREDRGAAVPLGPHLLLHGVADVARRVDVLERSEEHTSELQSLAYLVCGLLLEKEKTSW